MYVYLLHGLVIGIVRGLEIYPFKDHISVFTYGYLILISVLIVYLLSTNFVCKWTNPLINLKKPSSLEDNKNLIQTDLPNYGDSKICYYKIILKFCSNIQGYYNLVLRCKMKLSLNTNSKF